MWKTLFKYNTSTINYLLVFLSLFVEKNKKLHALESMGNFCSKNTAKWWKPRGSTQAKVFTLMELIPKMYLNSQSPDSTAVHLLVLKNELQRERERERVRVLLWLYGCHYLC